MRHLLSRLFSFLYYILPEKDYLKLRYYLTMGKKLDLKHPKTMNEKLQWLKLHDRNPLYSVLVDKYEVKDYVRQQIGGEYVIPVYGVWEHFDDIDFEKLPNQFVVQYNFGCGQIWICKDKDSANIAEWRRQFNEWDSVEEEGMQTGEWHYAEIPHKIVISMYLNSLGTISVNDYKFHCMHGQVYGCFAAYDRVVGVNHGVQFDHYDIDWNLTDAIRPEWHPKRRLIAKPVCYERMLEVCRILSKDFPYVRVDLYEVEGQVLFGELTFTPQGNVLNYYTDETLVDMLNFYQATCK